MTISEVIRLETVAIVLLIVLLVVREVMHHLSDVRKDRLIAELIGRTSPAQAQPEAEEEQPPAETRTYSPVSKDDEDLYKLEIEQNKV